MQQKMKSNICYLHDAGPNYSYIIPSIICGSCPQQQSDIDHLRDVVRPRGGVYNCGRSDEEQQSASASCLCLVPLSASVPAPAEPHLGAQRAVAHRRA
jgi:hypothetical protein